MSEIIEKSTTEIRAFRDARDWRQFHPPKDLAAGIAVEAGELLQYIVWKTKAESEERAAARREDIADELADVSILVFELVENRGINLAAAIRTKVAKNETRYPVDKARGSNRKYNEL